MICVYMSCHIISCMKPAGRGRGWRWSRQFSAPSSRASGRRRQCKFSQMSQMTKGGGAGYC